MTADEKIDEMYYVLDQRNQEIQNLKDEINRLSQMDKIEMVKEKIDDIVQKEVK